MEMINKKNDHQFPDSPTVVVAGKPGQRACCVEPVSCHQKLVYVGCTRGGPQLLPGVYALTHCINLFPFLVDSCLSLRRDKLG